MIQKILLIVACLSCVLAASGQDTLYLDRENNLVQTRSAAASYQINQPDKTHPGRLVYARYNLSGGLIRVQHVLDTAKEKPDGKYQEYYDNGQLHIDASYSMGKVDGKVITYWENGQIKRSDVYREGKYLKGTCYNKQGKPIPHFDYEKEPSFPGGEQAMMAYMRSHIKYPKKARKNNIQGMEIIGFTVKKDGRISNIRIKQSVDPELAQVAIKMIKGMPRWKPGQMDGETTDVNYALPVRFKLE